VFVQNLCRGHYATTADLPAADRVRFPFDELAPTCRRPALRFGGYSL